MAVWSEVSYNDLPPDLRLDSEYYQPDYLKLDRLHNLRGSPAWETIDGDFIVGPFGSAFLVENYVESSPYRYVRGRDVKPFFLLEDDNCYMPENDFERLIKYELREGDILVSVVGTLGNVAIVTNETGRAIFSCKSTAFRTNGLDPYYLCAYLNSAIGQSYFHRMVRGHVQTGLNLGDLKKIPVLIPNPNQIRRIGDSVRQAYAKRQDAAKFYARAENLLLSELGLDDADLSSSLCYEQNFSESQKAARLDPEYFQPRHYHLIRILKETGDAVRLGDCLREPSSRGIQPTYVENGGVVVINSQHVGKDSIDLDTNRRTSHAFVKSNNNKGQVKKYDVLLNSTGVNTIGRAKTLLEEPAAIVDSHVTILRPKPPIDPVYLGVFLHAMPGFLQTERGWTGSSGQIELRKDVIENFTVWNAPDRLQQKIRDDVERSHQARCESSRLLGMAVRMVEEAASGETP